MWHGQKPVKDKEPIMGIPLPVLSGNRQWVAKLPPVVGFLLPITRYKAMATQNMEKSENKDRVRYLILGLVILVFFIVFGSLAGRDNGYEDNLVEPSQTQITAEPRLLGKWFGKRNIYLGGGPKYLATFDPPLPEKSLLLPPTSSDPIYPYLVGLIDEVWGLSLSDLSNPRIVSPFIVYENLNGDGSFYFLPLKDETTRTVYGVGFEKK